VPLCDATLHASSCEQAETAVGEAEVQVLVRRGGDESFSMVSWLMSQHDERWLIDSLNIV